MLEGRSVLVCSGIDGRPGVGFRVGNAWRTTRHAEVPWVGRVWAVGVLVALLVDVGPKVNADRTSSHAEMPRQGGCAWLPMAGWRCLGGWVGPIWGIGWSVGRTGFVAIRVVWCSVFSLRDLKFTRQIMAPKRRRASRRRRSAKKGGSKRRSRRRRTLGRTRFPGH